MDLNNKERLKMIDFYKLNTIRVNDVKTVNDLKKHITGNKLALRHFYDPNEAYARNEVEWVIKETNLRLFVSGVGEKAVSLNGFFYNYDYLFKCLKSGFKNVNATINSFFILIFKDYEYIPFTDEDFKNLIKNRKNAQYLLKSEIPKYITVSEVYKHVGDLPVLKSIN